MIVTWLGKLFTLRVSRCDFGERLRDRIRERLCSQGTPGVDGRKPPGDSHHWFCGEILFRITAWSDDDLQVQKAALCRKSVL